MSSMNQPYNTPGDATYPTNDQHHNRQPSYAGPDNVRFGPAEPLRYRGPGPFLGLDDGDEEDDVQFYIQAEIRRTARYQEMLSRAVGIDPQTLYPTVRLPRRGGNRSFPQGTGTFGAASGVPCPYCAQIMPPPSQAGPATQGVRNPEPGNLPAPGHPGAAPEAYLGYNQQPLQPAAAFGRINDGPSRAEQQAWIALATRMGLLYEGEFEL
ncbi:hypothetical protein LTR56_013044 [Elasticomyces elasticus]|nr:hypothetical protein LTR22_025138 [Elasticomyces elasticus]KAK3638404.1 hypothetical protein LTR56_013044 [Elasticomyces elasticus]KAK4920500.1 hypothetical protein LTR49_011915 [Elasticomyces elasticus]KAK5758999.1 hypothetical protein LTS12_010940 [Elasticomyces elasticus]